MLMGQPALLKIGIGQPGQYIARGRPGHQQRIAFGGGLVHGDTRRHRAADQLAVMPLRRGGGDQHKAVLLQPDTGQLGQDTPALIGDVDKVDPPDFAQPTGDKTRAAIHRRPRH